MYFVAIAVLLLATGASATVVSTIVGFTSTDPVQYSPSGAYIEGIGTGSLTTTAGILPIGTAVNWDISTIIYPQNATVNGQIVTQDFLTEADVSITLASDGSNILFATSPLATGYATGTLGTSSATIVFPVSG